MNILILAGRLASDPEKRSNAVTVKLATSEHWTDKNTGQRNEATDFHRITVFGKTGEFLMTLKKGQPVVVHGSLHNTQWEDKATGQKRYGHEIRVNRLEVMGSIRRDSEAPAASPAPAFEGDDFSDIDFSAP